MKTNTGAVGAGAIANQGAGQEDGAEEAEEAEEASLYQKTLVLLYFKNNRGLRTSETTPFHPPRPLK